MSTQPRLLLVEDDRDVRDALENLLSLGGIEVRTVATADDALAAMPGFQPDVIVSDIDLGPTSATGFDLAEILARTVPMVLMSGLVTPERRTRAARLGVVELAAKPNVMPAVLRALRGLSCAA